MSWSIQVIDSLGSRGAYCKLVEIGAPQSYPITEATAGVDGTIKITGDHADEFPVGTKFVINGSTDNDGVYETSVNATFTDPDTTITVANLPDGTDDGVISELEHVGVAYYMLDGSDDIGKLRLAAANKLDPAGSGDWDIHTVDYTPDTASVISFLPPTTLHVDGDVSPWYKDGVTFRIPSGTYEGDYVCSGDATYDSGTDTTTVHVTTGPDATAHEVLDGDATHIHVAGNHSTSFATGAVFNWVGCTDPANNQIYESLGAVYDSGSGMTQIEVAEVPSATYDGNIYLQLAAGGSVVTLGGTGYNVSPSMINGGINIAYSQRRHLFLRCAMLNRASPRFPIGITASNSTLNTFTVAGDQTEDFVTGGVFTVTGSAGNDGEYTCTADATYNSSTDTTTITVGSVTSDAGDGTINLSSITTQTIRQVQDVAKDVAASVIDGKPAIAYFHEAELDLRYIRGNDAHPATSSDWTDMRVYSGVPSDLRGFKVGMVSWNYPAIFSYGSGRIWRHLANSTAPSDTTDFTPLAITPASVSPGKGMSVGKVDSVPVVAFYDLLTNTIKYARPVSYEIAATVTSTGAITLNTTDSSLLTRFTTGTEFIISGSGGNDGTYTCEHDATLGGAGGTQIIIYAPDDALPTSSNIGRVYLTDLTDWQIHTVDTGANLGDVLSVCCYKIRVDIESASIPADEFTVAGDLSAELGTGALFRVIRSSGNDGDYESTGASYDSGSGLTTVSVATVADATGDGVIEITNPYPAVLYSDRTNNKLKIAISHDPVPSASTDWETEDVFDGDIAWCDLHSINGRLCAVWYDTENWDLHFATREIAS